MIPTELIRSKEALTTSYVAAKTVDCDRLRAVSILLSLTWVDSTSCEWDLAWSPDGLDWYSPVNYSPSAGATTTVPANMTQAVTASVKWNDGPIAVQDRYLRVRAKKTGGSGADALAISVAKFGA